MAKRRYLGREAIYLLRNAYRDGVAFDNIYGIRAYLIKNLKVKPAFVPWESASNWDRQARLENARDEYANTFPSRSIGHARNPNADNKIRSASHRTDIRYLATRVGNANTMAQANAAQPDATRVEIRRAARLEVIAPMVQLLADFENRDG